MIRLEGVTNPARFRASRRVHANGNITYRFVDGRRRWYSFEVTRKTQRVNVSGKDLPPTRCSYVPQKHSPTEKSFTVQVGERRFRVIFPSPVTRMTNHLGLYAPCTKRVDQENSTTFWFSNYNIRVEIFDRVLIRRWVFNEHTFWNVPYTKLRDVENDGHVIRFSLGSVKYELFVDRGDTNNDVVDNPVP